MSHDSPPKEATSFLSRIFTENRENTFPKSCLCSPKAAELDLHPRTRRARRDLGCRACVSRADPGAVMRHGCENAHCGAPRSQRCPSHAKQSRIDSDFISRSCCSGHLWHQQSTVLQDAHLQDAHHDPLICPLACFFYCGCTHPYFFRCI